MTSPSTTSSQHIRESILQHLARYRMTTLPVLNQLPELGPLGAVRLQQQLQRLSRSGQIASAPLFHKREYLYLAGTDPTGPHSEVSKIRNYAMLLFCCLSNTSRDRLTESDFQEHFPDLYRPGRPLHYYMDISGSKPCLGFMRIDTGGRGRWDRVIARARSDICSHELYPPFRKLIATGQFEVSILTATLPKAERIRRTLEEGRHPADASIRVSAIPELLALVAPSPD